jgi:hypothetical protein
MPLSAAERSLKWSAEYLSDMAKDEMKRTCQSFSPSPPPLGDDKDPKISAQNWKGKELGPVLYLYCNFLSAGVVVI